MLNRCEFIGHLGADPEVRRTQSGDKVVSFRLAVSDSWRDRVTGERKEKTEWVTVVIWNENIANIAEQYLRKGKMVFVAGSMSTRRWQDQNGNDRYTTEIVLQKFRGELQMLDGKGGNDERSAQAQQTSTTTRNQYAEHTGRSARELDDEVPF